MFEHFNSDMLATIKKYFFVNKDLTLSMLNVQNIANKIMTILLNTMLEI